MRPAGRGRLSVRPRASRKSFRSSGGSSASSISTLALKLTTSATSDSLASRAESAATNWLPRGDLVLADIGGVQHRLGGEQVELPVRDLGLLVGLDQSGRLAFTKDGDELLQHRDLGLGTGVVGAGGLLGPVEALLEGGQVGEAELEVDDLAVTDRVHLAHHVLDVVVLEAPDDMDDRVHVADVGEELVAEALALAGTLDQAGDVHELHRGGQDPLRLDDVRQGAESRVRHLHHAGVRLDGGKRVVGHQRPRRSERVEQAWTCQRWGGRRFRGESMAQELEGRRKKREAKQGGEGNREERSSAPFSLLPSCSLLPAQATGTRVPGPATPRSSA